MKMEKRSKQKGGNFVKGFKKRQEKEQKVAPFKKKTPKTEQFLDNVKNLQEQYDKIDVKTVEKFTDLPLSSRTLKALEESGFTSPTEIQRESLGLALRGLDILGAAKTGSGKTLAFLIPILERLFCQRWTRQDGVGALVITPTRELAYQIFETLKKVGGGHDFSAGLVIGGKDLKFETNRLHDCNIVICTPGRLLQHLDENPAFSLDNLQMVVLDEADRCLDLGFKAAMNAIISSLPPSRQTLLFSATQTRSVHDLARLSLTDPVYVSVHENAEHATPDSLSQSYIVVELHQKVDILWSFLKNHRKKKILVFMQSCKQVKYLYEIFCRLRPGLSVLALYGTLHQLRRMAIYEEFCSKSSAVLFATDIAARGLDFPAVDWVVQLDCPEDAVTYVHRAGRTARYSSSGESLLVLTESEEAGMAKQLAAQKIPIAKIEVNPAKQQSVQRKMAAYLASDKNLKESAQRAFQSYIKSIFLMRNKAVFDVTKLDTAQFATSLGLAAAPRVRFLEKQLKIAKSKEKTRDECDEELVKEEDESNIGAPVESVKVVKDEKTVEKTATITKFGDDSDSDDEDILTVKRKDHVIANDDLDEEFGDEEKGMGKKVKVVTKASAAKKILKKKIQANTVVRFDEEGETVSDGLKLKASEAGKKYEMEDEERFGGGIDLDRAKEILREEDKHDKVTERARIRAAHKEQKRKEKEAARRKKNDQEEEDDEEDDGDSETESVDLSWLPDPDKVYGKQDTGDEGENENEDSDEKDDGDVSEDEEQTEVKVGKRKITVVKKVIPKKKARVVGDEEEDDDMFVDDGQDNILDTGLSMVDDEDLALQLLSK